MRKILKKTLPIFALLLIPTLYFYPFWKGQIPYSGSMLFKVYSPWRDYQWELPKIPFTVENYHIMDAVRQIFPWQLIGIQTLKNGEWPLWNPYAFGGTPLLANNQSALLYPLNFLYFIFEFPIAWGILTVLQPILASIFLYFLLKEYQIKPWIRAWGATLFGWSGFFSAFIHTHTLGHTLLWLPLILLALHKLAKKFSSRWIFVFILSLIFMFTAGYIQIAIYSLLLILLYIFTFLKPHFSKKQLLAIIALLILALGASSPQIIPTLEFIKNMKRDPSWYSNLLLPPIQLTRILSPHALGHPITRNLLEGTQARMYSYYIGLYGLLFAIVAITQLYKQRKVLFWAIMLFIIIIFTTKNPISQPFYSLLPFLQKATPQRALSLINLSLAILSSLGLNHVWQKREKSLKTLTLILLILFVTATSLVILRYNHPETSHSYESFPFVLIPSLSALAGLILLFVYKAKLIKKFLIVLLVFCLLGTTDIIFENSLFSRTFVAKEYIFPKTRLIQFLEDNLGNSRFLSLDPWTLPPNTFLAYKLRSISVYDPAQYSYSHDFAERWRTLKNPESEPFTRAVEYRTFNQNLLDITNTKFVLSSNSITSENLKFIRKIGKSFVYENINDPAYAFLVGQTITIKSDEKAAERLFAPNFNPKQSIIIPNELNQAIQTGNSKVTLLGQTTQEMFWQVETATPQVLFISESYNPGWQAMVNGEAAKIHRANLAFQAIFIPKGKHSVSLEYKPKSFYVGLKIAVFSLTILLGTSIVMIVFTKRHREKLNKELPRKSKS